MTILDSADRRTISAITPGRRISLELLDGFRLTVDSKPCEISDTTQRLVAVIALGRHPQSRAIVAGTLWPEKPEARAAANLRSSLWRLTGAGLRSAILSSGSSLAINPEVQLDVTTLERHGWGLLDGSPTAVRDLPPNCFSRELLPGWFEDWVILERERLGQLQIRFLESLVHHLRELGDYPRAIDQAMRLVTMEPLRERSQLALIHALVEEGSWGRARWQADDYCRLLDDAFGSRAAEAFVSKYRAVVPFDQVLQR